MGERVDLLLEFRAAHISRAIPRARIWSHNGAFLTQRDSANRVNQPNIYSSFRINNTGSFHERWVKKNQKICEYLLLKTSKTLDSLCALNSNKRVSLSSKLRTDRRQ